MIPITSSNTTVAFMKPYLYGYLQIGESQHHHFADLRERFIARDVDEKPWHLYIQCTPRYIWCIFVDLELVGIPPAKYPLVVGYARAIISLPFFHFAFHLSTSLIYPSLLVAWREPMDAIPNSQKLSNKAET